jgi:GNAT superfamily N-acetyltransferase
MSDNILIHVRHATIRDLATIVAFNQGLATETEGRQIDEETLQSGVKSALADPTRCLYFVAEHEGAIVGQCMVTFEWSDWRNGWLWWFQSVYVHENHRRQGVFRTLYEYVAKEARTRDDVRGLRLYVEKDNRHAMRTYEDLGMIPSGHLVYEWDWSDALRPASD